MSLILEELGCQDAFLLTGVGGKQLVVRVVCFTF